MIYYQCGPFHLIQWFASTELDDSKKFQILSEILGFPIELLVIPNGGRFSHLKFMAESAESLFRESIFIASQFNCYFGSDSNFWSPILVDWIRQNQVPYFSFVIKMAEWSESIEFTRDHAPNCIENQFI